MPGAALEQRSRQVDGRNGLWGPAGSLALGGRVGMMGGTGKGPGMGLRDLDSSPASCGFHPGLEPL